MHPSRLIFSTRSSKAIAGVAPSASTKPIKSPSAASAPSITAPPLPTRPGSSSTFTSGKRSPISHATSAVRSSQKFGTTISSASFPYFLLKNAAYASSIGGSRCSSLWAGMTTDSFIEEVRGSAFRVPVENLKGRMRLAEMLDLATRCVVHLQSSAQSGLVFRRKLFDFRRGNRKPVPAERRDRRGRF